MGTLYYKFRDVPPVMLWLSLFYIALKVDNSVNTYALGIILFSQFIRVWSRRYIGQHSRGTSLEAPELHKTGPYSISRNPLYISNMLFGAGLIILLNMWGIGVVLIFLLFIGHYRLVAIIEESFLQEKFQAEYHEWARETPRLFGFNLNYVEGVPNRTMFQAIIADSWTWIFQYCMVVVFLVI